MLEVDPIEPEASFLGLSRCLLRRRSFSLSLPFLWFLPISGLFWTGLRQRDAALLTRLGTVALDGVKPDREAVYWQYYI